MLRVIAGLIGTKVFKLILRFGVNKLLIAEGESRIIKQYKMLTGRIFFVNDIV